MPKNEVAMRIFNLADKQFSEQKDFAIAIGVKPSIVSQWRNDNTTSFKGRLDVIAQVLGTTTDYLLYGQKRKPTPLRGSGLSDEALEVAAAYDRAAKKDQDTVRFILADCLPRPLAAREGDGVAPTEEEMPGVTVAGEDHELP